jgi:hypothetical protein
MSCNNYTATKIPVSVGFDANGNAGSLVETKEIKVTKIEAYKDPESDGTTPLIIDAGEGNEVIFTRNVRIDGELTTNSVTIEGASALSSLTDVDITSVGNGEVLVWSSNDWINRTLSEAGILGTTDLANYATNTYVSSNYATSNSLSAYAPSSWVNSNFLATTTVGTTVQAYGTALQAIRALTPAADRLPYFNGGSTAATATLTSFARTLLDDANVGTMQATLQLRPGTEVQNQNQSLQDIADIDTGVLNPGDVIQWGGSRWEAAAQTGGGGATLNDLTDVTITAAANNEFLIYDTGVNRWVDKTPAEARSALGANTLGSNIITATNNGTGGGTYLRVNFDNSVEVRTYAQVQDDLDVVPGTNVQAYDAGLQSIANLNPGANTLVYFTATDVAATSPLTQFGRSLLDDANAIECRGTLSAQVSALSLDNIKSICDATGPSAFGRLLYTVPNGVVPGVNILPVTLFDETIIANNYGKVLSLRDPGGSVYAQPQFQFLFFGELGNVNLGAGAGKGGNLTAGRILYVDGSQNLTELANPTGDNFLKHNGTTPSWRSTANLKSDLGISTTDSPQFAGVNIGNATDTTITRTAAGVIAVENKRVFALKNGETPAEGDVFYFDGNDFVRLAAPASNVAVLINYPLGGGNPPEWIEIPGAVANYTLKSVAGTIQWVED